jgi:hypothetical protein
VEKGSTTDLEVKGMKKLLLVVGAGLLASGMAVAQSSLDQPRVAVKPVSMAEAMSLVKGKPEGLWCDSLGYQWDLSGAGIGDGVISITGAALNMCGQSPASGTLRLARGLPLNVTANVNPGCFCNEFHSMELTYSRGVFTGMAYATGSCYGEAPITLGKC